jgi:hypothetical protein
MLSSVKEVISLLAEEIDKNPRISGPTDPPPAYVRPAGENQN